MSRQRHRDGRDRRATYGDAIAGAMERHVAQSTGEDASDASDAGEETPVGTTPAPSDPTTQDPAALEIAGYTRELADQEARMARALREAAQERGIRGNLANVVHRLVDLSELEFDASGEPTNAAEVMDAFKSSHEKLFGIAAAAGSFDGGVRSEFVVPESPNTVMNRVLREQADRQRGRR